MKRIISLSIALAAIGGLLILFGCKKKKSYQPSGDKPAFRVLNFSFGSPEVYMTLDGWQNTGDPIKYLEYGWFGEYPYDNDGSQELRVYSPDTKATFLQKTVNMQDYYTYAIFTANFATQMDYLIVPVYNDPSSDYGKCRVRFINLCPNAGPVKLVQNNDTLFKDVAYLTATDYIEIASGDKMTQIYSATGQFLLSDKIHTYNGLEVKDIIISGYHNAVDTNFQSRLTIVEE
jgi:hypothetical protein